MAITSEEALVDAMQRAAGPVSVQGGGTRVFLQRVRLLASAGLEGDLRC